MTYKELPIDDSKGVEQFKVGDKVTVYSYVGHRSEGLVEDIDRDESSIKLDLDNPNYYHYKQCRKLVEVKAREGWVKEYQLLPFPIGEPEKDWIHLKEILHD